MQTPTVQTYAEAAHLWTTTRRRKLANNTYLERIDDPNGGRPSYAVRLHRTNVVTYHPDGSIVLDSGGWQTVTTKARMNAHTPPAVSVWQDRHEWYVGVRVSSREDGQRWNYADGFTLDAETLADAVPA